MLKAAVIAGCVTAICSSMADGLAADRYKSRIRTISGLIIIISVFQPLLKIDFDGLVSRYSYEFESVYDTSAEDAFSRSVVEAAQEKLEEYIEAKLICAGIKPVSVSIQLTVTEDGKAEVTRTDVIISRDSIDAYDDAKRIVEDQLMQGTVNISWEGAQP